MIFTLNTYIKYNNNNQNIFGSGSGGLITFNSKYYGYTMYLYYIFL